MRKIKLLTPILVFTTLLGATTATVGCSCNPGGGGGDEPIQAVDFNTCQWADVTDACNKLENGDWTEQQFCQRFKFGETQATKLDDFVGKTRDIVLNAQTHHVRVVGIKQDYLDESSQKPIIFTFQFDNVISKESDGTGLTVKWDVTDNTDYWNSQLVQALNSTDDVDCWNDSSEHQSVYSMISETEQNLASNIKNVYRGVNTDTNEDSTYELTRQTTKLFCPTISNYFSNEGIDDATFYISEAQRPLYKREGQPHDESVQAQYKYFENEIGDQSFAPAASFDCLTRADMTSNFAPYWLSSPNISDTATIWQVSYDGSIAIINPDTPYCVAPCFCI